MGEKGKAGMGAALLLCVLIASCAAPKTVYLRNYNPEFTAGLGEYKGKRVYLMNFDNRAWNTTTFHYFSPDRAFAYTGDSLIHNYFWYAFEKAFIRLGVSVANQDQPDLKAPAMWLTLKSVTDDRYEVEVKIKKRGGVVFSKIYVIFGDPLREADRNRENLEKRAYSMTNRLIQTIFVDPEFKKAFFERRSIGHPDTKA